MKRRQFSFTYATVICCLSIGLAACSHQRHSTPTPIPAVDSGPRNSPFHPNTMFYQGEVTRLVEHRIGLEGETRLCAEFSDEHAADKFFDQLHSLTHGVDLVNIKKEVCTP